MRVALLTRFFNDRNAGIGVYSRNLLLKLLENGMQVDTYSSGFMGRVGYFAYSLFELGIKSLSFDSDVYHALTPVEALWTPPERTVVTFHDLIPMLHLSEIQTHYASGGITKFVSKRYFTVAARRAIKAKRIICVSEQTREEVLQNLGYGKGLEGKVSVIRQGISPNLRPKRGKPFKNEEFTIGTLSYLDPRKRIDILIDAFKEADIPDSELLIPSTGADEGRLKKIAGNDKRIKFLGYLPEKDKTGYLSSLDVFVLPSKFEGYGIPFVESFACKTPAVSFDDALIPSDVKRRTHIVSGKSELVQLFERREFGCDLNGNYKFAKKHDWDKCAEETIKVYGEVLAWV